ncbi:WD40/YVTN/BNR-like repeat-containing protein [Prosthecodimorpha staleyi]|uniref:Exo-alpha-sialidase n=1 Tax=Prosthecodimorpha staleyi TaxID=2840188 RepID=A0A947D851_9HYPH|nr:exo-alpha-sialidase [Prosthecodimorpha staleyi]MBT9292860.1 exo-alpha-sialidase [Prosthecodimorpha staleyi]
MATKTLLLLGTRKGAFLLESDAERRDWTVHGPFCEMWPINHVVGDAETGVIWAAGGNEWFGPAIWKSSDLGRSWSHSSRGLAYPEGSTPVKSAWSLAVGHGRVYAGVEPAGVFASADGGESFEEVKGLSAHPSRPHWMPGGGGLILHHVLLHPDDPERYWVAISSAGVFETRDGGTSFTPRNRGVRCDYMPEDQRYPETGQCVHSIVMAAGRPDRLYQQNHCGMYRSDDGGENWVSIEQGLPSSFGFPAAAHPRDPDRVFLIPLNGDIAGRFMPDARAAVWRSADAGRTWADGRAGLPQAGAYFNVLRQAMATDRHDRPGLYFGTNSGSLYASLDEGASWSRIAENLPVIASVETMVIAA